MRRLLILLVLLVVAFAPLRSAQNPVAGGTQQQEVLTNADIITLVQAKVAVETIRAKIKVTENRFDTSASAIVALKNSGVPDTIITEMVLASATPPRPGVGVTAQQAQPGVQGAPVAGIFTSPMVLTTRFAAVDQSLWGKGDWFTVDEYRELAEFTCDGVSLTGAYDRWTKTTAPGLELAAKIDREGVVEIKVRVTIWNPPNNHDKSVTVVIELLDGTTTVRTATAGPISIEEGHPVKSAQTSFTIPLELLQRQPPLGLRLTVMVKDW